MEYNKAFKKSGWYVLAVLSLLPVLFWSFGLKLTLQFSTLQSATKSLGDISGLVGMAMFSLVTILAARLKIFEKVFNGINEVYSAHHIFGGLTLCLLLFHPLLLAYNYLSVSFKAAAIFLLLGSNMAQNLGTFGLFVMIITLVITFYLKIKYQVWKFTHKFMGLAFILAFFHAFTIGGDLLANPILKAYLFLLGAAAIAAYLYRALFADYLVKTFEYKISGISKYSDKIWELSMEASGKKIQFKPGQFAFIKFFNKNLSREVHPFSFSSAHDRPLKIAIKELGDYTDKIKELQAGNKVLIEGPFGNFSFRNFANRRQVWVAGGVGITPFLSMLRDLSEKDNGYKIDLYYSVKDESCLAFKEEIERISAANENLHVHFWLANKNKFLTAKFIKNDIGDLLSADILICGPTLMMASLKEQFLTAGIKKSKIHTEEFSFY